MTDLKALQRRARYGHKQIVYWYHEGEIQHRPFGRDGIKAAILSVGAKGRWYWLDGCGCSHIVRSLSFSLHIWRCAPRLT